MLNLSIVGSLEYYTNFKLRVPCNSKVSDIKISLCRASRIPTQCLQLYIDGKQLDNNQKTMQYCYQDGSRLSLVIKPLTTYKCIVRFPLGDYFEDEFEPSDYIQDLVDLVQHYIIPEQDVPFKLVLRRKLNEQDGVTLNPEDMFGNYTFDRQELNYISYETNNRDVTIQLMDRDNRSNLVLNKNNKVQHLKEKACRKLKLKIDQQVLLLNGKQLDDTEMNQFIGQRIKDNDIVSLLQRVE